VADNLSIEHLVQALRCLPGVGVKSAQRMAFHLLQHDREGAMRLSQALEQSVRSVRHCELCHTFTEAQVAPPAMTRAATARNFAWWRRQPIRQRWSAPVRTRACTSC